MQLRQLEKYMRILACAACRGQRLNPQARAVTVTTTHPQVRATVAELSLPEVCDLSITDADGVLQRAGTGRDAAR